MPIKRVSIKLIGDARDAYLTLKKKVAEEHAKGVTNPLHQILLKSIDDKISILKVHYDYGVHIPRRNVAHKYELLYDVTNLWKVNLAGAWRMIYTLKQPQREDPEVEIISIWLDVLDIINHKEYDKIFGYKKK